MNKSTKNLIIFALAFFSNINCMQHDLQAQLKEAKNQLTEQKKLTFYWKSQYEAEKDQLTEVLQYTLAEEQQNNDKLRQDNIDRLKRIKEIRESLSENTKSDSLAKLCVLGLSCIAIYCFYRAYKEYVN